MADSLCTQPNITDTTVMQFILLNAWLKFEMIAQFVLAQAYIDNMDVFMVAGLCHFAFFDGEKTSREMTKTRHAKKRKDKKTPCGKVK